jgi:hypothetical protein
MDQGIEMLVIDEFTAIPYLFINGEKSDQNYSNIYNIEVIDRILYHL